MREATGRFLYGDLSVTIDADELAAFYRVGERDILDHDP